MKEITIPGSVSQRGAKFLAQLPPSSGRRSKLHDTEYDAREWLRVEHAKRTLGVVDTPADKPTLAAMIDVWLAAHPMLGETTLELYRCRLDKHVKPHPYGGLPVNLILPFHIEKILSDCPPNYTRVKVASHLRSFFDWAQANEFTARDPYRRSRASAMVAHTRQTHDRKESTDNVWTPEQFITFIDHESCPVYRDYWIFAAATGVRRGEAIGLTWDRVIFDPGYVILTENITRGITRTVYQEAPKNGRERKAYFGPVIGKLLMLRQEEQEAYRCTLPNWVGNWVFDRRGGKGQDSRHGIHFAPATVTCRFNRHAREIGLPPLAGPHGLRRTFATIMEDEGFKPSVRIAALGHTPDVTGNYVKPSESDRISAAVRLEARILSRSWM